MRRALHTIMIGFSCITQRWHRQPLTKNFTQPYRNATRSQWAIQVKQKGAQCRLRVRLPLSLNWFSGQTRHIFMTGFSSITQRWHRQPLTKNFTQPYRNATQLQWVIPSNWYSCWTPIQHLIPPSDEYASALPSSPASFISCHPPTKPLHPK